MSKLMERVIKASGNPYADIFDQSKLVSGTKEYIKTNIPMLNVALSGKWDGGLTPGITIIAGKSKHFKSMLGLQLVKAFLDKHADGICIYIDSELGFGTGYLESQGVDMSRIAHIPVMNIEEAKFQIVSMLEETKPSDNVIIFYDSIGNTASKKEMDDAVDQKSVADMSRAKSIKSFFRIITPMVNIRKQYFVAINHVYSSQGMFPVDVMGGGCLVPGSRIIMADESLKNIENVSVGDKVKTKNGISDVYAVWNPNTLNNGTPECYEITLEDGYTIKCSENHKFLVNGEWISAKDLSIGTDLDII